MPEPTSSLSFEDLIIRVAELSGTTYHGVDGQGRATVPIDQFELDKCKRIVNDGIRMFIASAPPNGWHWMNRDARIQFDPDGLGSDNIDSDPARYLLPQHFAGEVAGPITYEKNTNHATFIEWTGANFIHERRAVSLPTGYPLYAAIQPYSPSEAPSLSNSRRYELIVFPTPVADDTIRFPYRVHFDNMQMESGLAESGTSSSLTDPDRDEDEGHFTGWTLKITSGAGRGGYATVTGFSDGEFTFDSLSNGATPNETSSYLVEPAENIHPAGFMFDDIIVAACLAETEKQVHETPRGYLEYFMQVALQNAWRIDGRTAPRSVGNMNVHARNYRERVWKNVTYEN